MCCERTFHIDNLLLLIFFARFMLDTLFVRRVGGEREDEE